MNTDGSADSWPDLFYTLSVTGEAIECRNRLVTTSLHSGGLRWWSLCPLIKDGQVCGARVKKLYHSPDEAALQPRTAKP